MSAPPCQPRGGFGDLTDCPVESVPCVGWLVGRQENKHDLSFTESHVNSQSGLGDTDLAQWRVITLPIGVVEQLREDKWV